MKFKKRAAALLIVFCWFCACCTPQIQDSPPTSTQSTTIITAGTPATNSADEVSGDHPTAFSERTEDRERMVLTSITNRDIVDPAVIEAMATVPRHRFVPADYGNYAYFDQPLPIGYGQTISQPYIVALMTQVVQPEPGDVVLEIGTGSGYQAAVLAEIVAQVYTIEIIAALAQRAEGTFADLAYTNITVRHADGYYGWSEYAPFDAIIVTAAPDHVPPPLKDQLADGGRMILPVGPPGGYQELWLVERNGDQFTTTSLGGVAFVPFTRDVRDE